VLTFPKPKDVKKPPVVVRVFRDGREKINQLCKAGRDLYQERKRIAWEGQGRLCGICHKPLAWADSTVDHRSPRGMGAGSIDDRQENLQAVHALCNSLKGSRRIPFADAP
jgi:HNH endonuclease